MDIVDGVKMEVIKQNPYKGVVVEKYKHFEANLREFQWSEGIC